MNLREDGEVLSIEAGTSFPVSIDVLFFREARIQLVPLRFFLPRRYVVVLAHRYESRFGPLTRAADELVARVRSMRARHAIDDTIVDVTEDDLRANAGAWHRPRVRVVDSREDA